MQTPRTIKKQGSVMHSSHRASHLQFNEVQNKVKEAVEGTQLGVYGFEQALKTVSGSKHTGTVTEDHLLLAFNRLKVNDISLDDVRDFFSSVKIKNQM